MGLLAGPWPRGMFVMTDGRDRGSPGPCSPAGRPGRGVVLYISAVSVPEVEGREEKPCMRA